HVVGPDPVWGGRTAQRRGAEPERGDEGERRERDVRTARPGATGQCEQSAEADRDEEEPERDEGGAQELTVRPPGGDGERGERRETEQRGRVVPRPQTERARRHDEAGCDRGAERHETEPRPRTQVRRRSHALARRRA